MRPEHVARFRKEGIKCQLANKNVKPGIETVSKLLLKDRLYLVKEDIMDLPKEFSLYVWGSDDEPVKTNDDALDGLRYAIYTDSLLHPNDYFPLIAPTKKYPSRRDFIY